MNLIYFFIRFIYLIIRLYLLALKSGFTRQEGFRMVEIQEEISPFSFFRFLLPRESDNRRSPSHLSFRWGRAGWRSKR